MQGHVPVGITGAGYSGVLGSQQAIGASLGGFTTAKSVINAQAQVNIQPNYFYVGKTLRITATGGLSNIVTTPGLIAFQVMLGPTANIIAFTTGNIQLNATAHTTLPFWFECLLTCRAIGAGTSAQLMGMGRVQGIQPTITAAQTDATNTGGIYSAPATAPTLGTGFNSTIANLLDFWVGFTISDPNNLVQIHTYLVEDLN